MPRPLGLTQRIKQINMIQNQNRRKELLDRTKQEIVCQYIQQGNHINGKPVTINTLAHFLSIPNTELLRMMNREHQRLSGMFDSTDANPNPARALLAMGLNWVLENLNISKSQLNMLMAAQQQSYQPFLTSEVNKAIANHTNALKPLLDSVKLLTDKSQTNPFASQSVQITNQYITTAEATKLLESPNHNSMLSNPESIPQLLPANTNEWPVVDAKYQDLSKIGIKQPS